MPDGGGKLISGDGRGDPYEDLCEVVFVQGEALSSFFTLQNKNKSAGAKPSDQLSARECPIGHFDSADIMVTAHHCQGLLPTGLDSMV